MTENQVLDLISRGDQYREPLTWAEVTQLYARRLSAISHKLNRDDLAELVAIGGLMHRQVQRDCLRSGDLLPRVRLDDILEP